MNDDACSEQHCTPYTPGSVMYVNVKLGAYLGRVNGRRQLPGNIGLVMPGTRCLIIARVSAAERGHEWPHMDSYTVMCDGRLGWLHHNDIQRSSKLDA